LPEPLGAALTDAAHSAFAHALRVAAALSMVMVLALAALVWVVLRRTAQGGQGECQDQRHARRG
jgi:hypothetical protein